MASFGMTIRAGDYDTTQRSYSELPNGVYVLEMESSDVVPTKDGRGVILKATNSVVQPESYANRKLFTTYNISNPSPVAEKIGREQLASLMEAIGGEDFSTDQSEELHFRQFLARVELGKPSKDGQYPAKAEIKEYFFPHKGPVPEPHIFDVQPAANDNQPASQRPANDNQPAPAQRVAAAGGKKPWSK